MGAVQSTVDNAVNDAVKGVVDLANDAKTGIVDTANDAKDAISDTFDDVQKELEDVSKKVTDGAGAIGRSMGDMFYPDNPNRRRRMEQLQSDISTLQAQYEERKAQVLQQTQATQQQIDRIMRANKYVSFEDLDRKIQGMGNGDAVRKWNEFKVTLNRNIGIEQVVMTTTALLTIATGVFAYGMALCGIITVATAGLALKVTGAVALALTILLAVVVIIDGAEEVDRLQDAIEELCFNRVEAKQALEIMNINLGYVSQFQSFLEDDYLKERPEAFDNFTLGDYRTALEKITRDNVAAGLKEYDMTRADGAWTNEDPDYSRDPGGKPDKVLAMLANANSVNTKPTLGTSTSSLLNQVEEVKEPNLVRKPAVMPPDTNLQPGVSNPTKPTASSTAPSNDRGTRTGNDNSQNDRDGRKRDDRSQDGRGGRGGDRSRGERDQEQGRGGRQGRRDDDDQRDGRGGNGQGGRRGEDWGNNRGDGRGNGRGDGRGQERRGRWRSPARCVERHRPRRDERGNKIFEKRIDDAEQPVLQIVHSKSARNESVLKQQFKVLKFDDPLTCTVYDVMTKHQYKLKANLQKPPSKDVDIRNVRFTLTDETDKKVYQDCRLLLRGRAAMPA